MKTLEENFREFLEQEHLTTAKILLCVSGGVDSMCLLDIAVKNMLKQNIFVFHLNHNSRSDTDKDEKIVQKFCTEKGVQFHNEKLIELPKKNHENFWRIERKKRAKAIAKKYNCERILTAHHATDLVETMIFRLVKGTGLSGMSPFESSTKPLLKNSKEEILTYAKDNKIPWNEDISNEDEKFSRNNIRKNILPHLRKITPNLEKVFLKESENFREIFDYIENQTPEIGEKMLLEQFLRFPRIIQKNILQKKAGKIISSDELNDFLRWVENNPKGETHKRLGNAEIKFSRKFLWF